MSFSLFVLIASNDSTIAPDPVRLSLESSSACWFSIVKYAGYAVAAGCVMEAPGAILEVKRWWLLRFRHIEEEETAEEKKSWFKPIAALGLFLVVVGIVLETFAEVKVSNIDAQIRSHESDVLSVAEEKSGHAQISAAAAIQKAAQIGKDTEELKAEAAIASRDMIKAQLELARFTGPVHLVPVIHGVARPDLSKGLIQQILLKEDVRIMPPILPETVKDGTAPWTLFLDQDGVGSHQYTFEFMREVKAYPGLVPNSRASFEFVTDTNGRTTIRGIPLVDMPNTTTKPSKK